MKTIRTREIKPTHIEILVSGPVGMQVKKSLLTTLRKMKCHKEISYRITISNQDY